MDCAQINYYYIDLFSFVCVPQPPNRIHPLGGFPKFKKENMDKDVHQGVYNLTTPLFIAKYTNSAHI
tara:strand:- start:706 stop:906 length:201 start_codon:yes stop_codon:yes gene_type:complete